MSAARVVVIGNFDGVHRGHQKLIAGARRAAGADGTVIAVTFWPHPMSVIRPDRMPLLLTELDERKRLLSAAGVDEVVVVGFTDQVASWPPERFVDEVLRPLQPTVIMVGENFRFGFRAAGDVELLTKLGREGDGSGFEVDPVSLLLAGDLPDSSTRVRAAIAEGDVDLAAELLNRPFRVRGEVIKGAQRGREMGFPTANVPVPRGLAVPADGVYAGWLSRLDQPDAEPWPAAISVGSNPTFVGENRRVESYVLDRTDLDLYGVEVAVDFEHRLRGQIKYSGMAALIDQMHLDVDRARSLLDGRH
ncbi:bifunctional riboflavin kinase/FAD synthetase [Microlunatus elymi]|uniref:Riboflavin biosynthesis protein n=1 Tax=Microlunatus elymi TaxID=2596828 RepID=A0A516PYP2_9ACTN|nr:bifunctional riboflavin kinase/FAD synthetase [Microlunatus elymi]QDP96288.1 bifunctional riboflavin kinase/FAD synthetase [Microlunatus elymi]